MEMMERKERSEMIEQYVVNELKDLKKDNEELKNYVGHLMEAPVLYIDKPPVEIELLDSNVVIERLKSANVDLVDLLNQSSSVYAELIAELKLYKELLNRKRSDYKYIIKIGNKYWGCKDYYGGIKTEDEVFVTLEDAIGHLTDDLYDIVYREVEMSKKQEAETSEEA